MRVSVGTGGSGSATARFDGDTIAENTTRGVFSPGGGIASTFNLSNDGIRNTGSGVALISISNTTINGNHADGTGGGLAARIDNEASGFSALTLNNVSVSGNTTALSGGGMFLNVSHEQQRRPG